jgi:hypothetical protein
MKTTLLRLWVAVVILMTLTSRSTVEGQLIRKPSDLDPFNRNGTVRKAGGDFDNGRLDQMSRTPRAGRDYTKIYLKNNTSKTIWAAVRFTPFTWSDGTTSELKSLDTQGSAWSTKAWYKLSPGQSVHVGNTNNAYVYTYAEGGGSNWSGKHYVDVRDGERTRRLGFSTRMIGVGPPESQTFSFGE